MLRRLYWLLPDVESARRTGDDLLLARVEHRHMHFLARRGTDLGELHEASMLQKTDVRLAAVRGLFLGGLLGALAAWLLTQFPIAGLEFKHGGVLLMIAFGAIFGIFASTPRRQLGAQFQTDEVCRRNLTRQDPADGGRALRARRGDPDAAGRAPSRGRQPRRRADGADVSATCRRQEHPMHALDVRDPVTQDDFPTRAPPARRRIASGAFHVYATRRRA